MMSRFNRYINKKGSRWNPRKSKLMKFGKGGVRESGARVKKNRSQGVYIPRLQRNGGEKERIWDRCKIANAALGQVRGICEGKFKANFGIRIIMFDYITKSINWGSKGQRKIGNAAKYMKWAL